MGWVQDDDRFVVADDGRGRLSDFADILGTDGEIYHIQNVGRIMAHCAELQKNRGISKEREFERLASIPLVVMLNHPALSQLDTNEELAAYIRKYLPQYSTTHETHGESIRGVVVK